MRIFHCPIESYDSRYTVDWVSQFERVFKENIEITFFKTIGDTSIRKIEDGCVLDACGTHMYKFKQLHELMTLIKNREIQDGDIIFFADAWFPGLESLFYVRAITGINFKIAGILHAGTWDPYDFTSRTNMRYWGQDVELSWLKGMDLIFVATQWHKDLIVMNSGDFDRDKIFVTGLPFYAKELEKKYPIQEKENFIVFPHRLDIEKHPEKFERLARKYPKWTFIKTMEKNFTRNEYFRVLARSKVMVSFAEQETFGYSTLEAMALGNFVIVPDSLSYREIVPSNYRYTKENQISDMLEKYMNGPEFSYATYPKLSHWEDSINRMIRVISVTDRTEKRKSLESEETLKQTNNESERKDRLKNQEEE